MRAEELAPELLLQVRQGAVDEEAIVGRSGEDQRVVGLEPDDVVGGRGAGCATRAAR